MVDWTGHRLSLALVGVFGIRIDIGGSCGLVPCYVGDGVGLQRGVLGFSLVQSFFKIVIGLNISLGDIQPNKYLWGECGRLYS